MSEDHRDQPTAPTPAADAGTPAENWEKDLLNRLAFAALNEQRRARRWSQIDLR